jgi:hypothetical protein
VVRREVERKVATWTETPSVLICVFTRSRRLTWAHFARSLRWIGMTILINMHSLSRSKITSPPQSSWKSTKKFADFWPDSDGVLDLEWPGLEEMCEFSP